MLTRAAGEPLLAAGSLETTLATTCNLTEALDNSTFWPRTKSFDESHDATSFDLSEDR